MDSKQLLEQDKLNRQARQGPYKGLSRSEIDAMPVPTVAPAEPTKTPSLKPPYGPVAKPQFGDPADCYRCTRCNDFWRTFWFRKKGTSLNTKLYRQCPECRKANKGKAKYLPLPGTPRVKSGKPTDTLSEGAAAVKAVIIGSTQYAYQHKQR